MHAEIRPGDGAQTIPEVFERRRFRAILDFRCRDEEEANGGTGNGGADNGGTDGGVTTSPDPTETEDPGGTRGNGNGGLFGGTG